MLKMRAVIGDQPVLNIKFQNCSSTLLYPFINTFFGENVKTSFIDLLYHFTSYWSMVCALHGICSTSPFNHVQLLVSSAYSSVNHSNDIMIECLVSCLCMFMNCCYITICHVPNCFQLDCFLSYATS